MTESSDAWDFVSHIEDITERKRAEEAIRASEERVRLLMDSTAEAIYGIDLQGDCTFANAACLRMLGYADVPIGDRQEHARPVSPHTRRWKSLSGRRMPDLTSRFDRERASTLTTK